MRAPVMFAVVTLLTLLSMDAHAWQPIEGRILQVGRDEALANVEIRVQLSGPPSALINLAKPQPFAVTRSDAAGRFRIDLPRETGAVAWDKIDAVVLSFVHPQFRTHAEHLRRALAARPIEVRLERDLKAASLGEKLRGQLEKLRAGGANTIFVVPYVVRGQAGPGASDVAEILKASLGRAVRQHVSAFTLANPPPEISVKLLDPREFEIDDTTALGAVADFLDALAVMSGRIDPGSARPRAATAIVSTYFLSQAITAVPVSYKTEDALALDAAHMVTELQRSVAPKWSRLSVLAIGARELQQARSLGDVQRLRAVQQLLVQELRGTGRMNTDFVPQLQALQQEAEETLRRLGQR